MEVTQTVDTTERLAKLRELMRQPTIHVQAVVIPSEDQHSSEFIARCDERRAFISGFDGSAGCAVVTLSNAYLFTDGRYFLQAEKQLDANWTLMKQGLPDVPTWQDFLWKRIDKGARIGIDPTVISAVDANILRESLQLHSSELVPMSQNLVDIVWGKERPKRPTNRIIPLDVNFAGETAREKIGRIQEELRKKAVKAVVVNMLDEVAWLFNLRGSDIDYNPVFFAYAVVTPDTNVLFVNPQQIDDGTRACLSSLTELHDYEDFFPYLKEFAKELQLHDDGNKILIEDKASLAIEQAIGKENTMIAPSPVAALKAIKNTTEIEGFRRCHIRDGAALVRYFSWLERQLESGVDLTECDVADKLEQFRSESSLFRGLSFPTISATGPNGAIIHYTPDPADCAVIRRDQLYLCDSGAQYLDGTTDVTRTWHFGNPSAEEKRAFTRVLQGHIAIDTVVFPFGTTGYVLDSLARRPLWQDGLDYRHGTGHGVGHFLNVHEGPQGIGIRLALNNTAFKPGMTVTIEPGYYADGKFGIRIENVVIVRQVRTPNNFGNGVYLGFEHVTFCPISKKLIDVDLITEEEKAWLNAYHLECLQKLSVHVQNDTAALAWLERECLPL